MTSVETDRDNARNSPTFEAKDRLKTAAYVAAIVGPVVTVVVFVLDRVL